MYKRSMGGRIYQQKTFRPKPISMHNPQQRHLHYPIKGDTSFDPQQYGKKHYLSPKHSAIHSIIFNEDYDSLMKQKRDLIDKINSSRNTHRFDEKADKQKIHGLNNYLNGYVLQQNRLSNHGNVFPPYHHYGRREALEEGKVLKGHLFRQGSMHQVLKPYEAPIDRDSLMPRNSSMLQMANKYHRSSNYDKTKMDQLSLSLMPKNDFPRLINPNNLNSNF